VQTGSEVGDIRWWIRRI